MNKCDFKFVAWLNDLPHCAQLCGLSWEWVLVQISSLVKWLVTLCTIVQFLSSVSYHMGSKLTSTRKWFAALHTPLCLFSRMSELVVLQTSGLIKCLIALITFIKVRSTAVGCHMVHKGCAVCLWTQVTRICLCHRKGLNQAQRVVNMYWRYTMVGWFLLRFFIFFCLGHTCKLFHFVHWFQNSFCFCSKTFPSHGGNFFWLQWELQWENRKKKVFGHKIC